MKDKLPALLESGDIAYETGVSATWIRELVRKGVLVPVARTPRGVRLFDPAAVSSVKQWFEDVDKRAKKRREERALNRDIQEGPPRRR